MCELHEAHFRAEFYFELTPPLTSSHESQIMKEAAIHRPESYDATERAPLSEVKRRLLQKYLHGGMGDTGGEPTLICPRPHDVAIPLSFAQQQIWLHGQMAGDIPFYNETMTVYRHGPLDLATLERCLLEIIRRHAIWRTTFEVIRGQPVQIIHPAPRMISLPLVDLRKLSEPERERKATRLATEDARRPFDLKNGPLLRALLVRMEDEQFRLYITVHQIIFDAVTAYRVFLPELATLYQAFVAGKPSPQPDLRIQYADFAYWQQKVSLDRAGAEHLGYWRKQLAGEISPLQ